MNSFVAVIALAACVMLASGAHHHEEHHGPAHYKFEYGVHDPHTHDIKSHHEHADGKQVTGEYTLKEADGTTRTVKYHADKHGGFNAVVERKGHAQHPAHYGYGHDHKKHGGVGGTSYVGVTHYGYKH